MAVSAAVVSGDGRGLRHAHPTPITEENKVIFYLECRP